MALMVRGAQHRSVAATQMNEESSRSHSILTATIDTRERAPNGDTTCRSSRINLVDLAGAPPPRPAAHPWLPRDPSQGLLRDSQLPPPCSLAMIMQVSKFCFVAPPSLGGHVL